MNLYSQDKIKEKIPLLKAKLRPGQIELTQWQGGKMAVSAVPGSGKSYSLAVASAIAVYEQNLNQNHYLLIVTYGRSAAASIREKIKTILINELHLPPLGFVVQTIHSLASNIVNRYSLLSRLNLDVNNLVDISPNHPLILETVENWMNLNSDAFQALLRGKTKFNGEEGEILRRESVLRTEVLPQFTYTVIRTMKSSGWELDHLKTLDIFAQESLYPLISISSELYQEYQKLTHKYQLIDYDDLILGALNVLQNDKARKALRQEIRGVFEDEAQDSTPLQGDLLSILAQDDDHSEPNLVRVGDPNQAINSTYTASDPFYFHNFCQQCRQKQTFFLMEQAGRSSKPIIDYANQSLKEFINKTKAELIELQEIKIVPQNDSQPDANPLPEGKGVEYYPEQPFPQLMEIIATRIIDLFKPNQHQINHNCAILVRKNKDGNSVFQALAPKLASHNIPVKLVGDRLPMNEIVRELLGVLQFIAYPHSSKYVYNLLRILADQQLIKEQDFNILSIYPERFLYPTKLDDLLTPEQEEARQYCLKLLKASIELSSYQLIPFIFSLLNYQKSTLANAQKLGDRLEKENRGKMSLKTMIETLIEINNSEKLEAIDTESEEIYTKKGQVTILTMHKSKGLEWDYIFLPFYNLDNIGKDDYTNKTSKFLGEFSLDDVIRTQLRQAIHQRRLNQTLQPLNLHQASEKARQEKIAEEYRLRYVAITRAKKLLWLSPSKPPY